MTESVCFKTTSHTDALRWHACAHQDAPLTFQCEVFKLLQLQWIPFRKWLFTNILSNVLCLGLPIIMLRLRRCKLCNLWIKHLLIHLTLNQDSYHQFQPMVASVGKLFDHKKSIVWKHWQVYTTFGWRLETEWYTCLQSLVSGHYWCLHCHHFFHHRL